MYGEDEKTASVEIVSDSPMLAGINSLLNMPTFMSGSDPNQKRIKIKGYKALLNKSVSEEGVTSWEIRMPFYDLIIAVNSSS